jgi:hypothetical protein
VRAFYLEKPACGMASIPQRTAFNQIGSVPVARARIPAKLAADAIPRELVQELKSEVGVTGTNKKEAAAPDSAQSESLIIKVDFRTSLTAQPPSVRSA